jgi:hypothetical protein
VRLVVEVDAVDLGVLADPFGLGRHVGGHLVLLASSLTVRMLMRPSRLLKLIDLWQEMTGILTKIPLACRNIEWS